VFEIELDHLGRVVSRILESTMLDRLIRFGVDDHVRRVPEREATRWSAARFSSS
jgi:hypothetical protein